MQASPRLLPKLQRNVGTVERIFSLALGSYFIYRAFHGKHRVIKGIAGSVLIFRGATANCPLYDAMHINTSSPPKPIRVQSVLTVNKKREEVYDFWRRLENLPSFMKHLANVTVIDDKRSAWQAHLPGGMGTLEWESEIVRDVPNELIEWKSVADALVENSGIVSFKDAGKYGTEVFVEIFYNAPAGYLGKGIGELLNPLTEAVVREDIKNFKRMMETGELPTIEGQASGKNK